MKSKCSFILKALTAMVLVFLLLFGTVATSLAAVVEELAETGWADLGKVYYDNRVTQWSDVYLYVGNAGWTSAYHLTQVGSTNVYAYSGTLSGWADRTGIFFAGSNPNSITEGGTGTGVTSVQSGIASNKTNVLSPTEDTNNWYYPANSSGGNLTRKPIYVVTGSSPICSTAWSNTADVMFYDSANDEYTYTYESVSAVVNAKIAVVQYNTWSALRWSDKGTLTDPSGVASWDDAGDGDHNIGLTLTDTADVTITRTSASKVNIDVSGGAAGCTPTITAGSTSIFTNQVTLITPGHGDDPCSGSLSLTTSGGTLTSNGDGTYNFSASAAGTYTLTATCDSAGLTHTQDIVVSTPAVYLNWGTSSASTSQALGYDATATAALGGASEHLVFSYSLNLTASSYKFRLYDGSDRYCSDVSDSVLLTDTGLSASVGDGSSYFTVTTDGAATYNIYYDLLTHKFYIEYPYGITYNMNGHGDQVASEYIQYGTVATFTAPTAPTATGYTFEGWFTDNGTWNDEVVFGDTVSGDIIAYAKWKLETVGVSLKSYYGQTEATTLGTTGGHITNAGGTTITQIDADVVNSGTVKAVAETAAGYKFIGWETDGSLASSLHLYTDSSCTTPYTSGDTSPIYIKADGTSTWTTANAIVKAKFIRITYTVSYAGGTGAGITGSHGDDTKIHGTDLALPNAAVFSRPNYTQIAWTTTDGGAQTHAFGADYTVDADQTFYPVWEEDLHSVTVAAGTGGKISINNTDYYDSSDAPANYPKSVTAGVSTKADVYAQANSGYFFTGWTDDGAITYDSTNNANKLHAQINATADSKTVTATFAQEFAVKGLTIYLYDNATSHLSTPKVYFASDVNGTNATEAATATQYSTTHIYHVEVPSETDHQWNCVKFTNADGSIDSDWQPITSVLTNSVTYDNSGFHDITFSTKSYPEDGGNHGGRIYFDNTNTNWSIDSTDKLWVVIGRGDYTSAYEMSPVTNTAQLYYGEIPDWNNYTYFGFARMTDSQKTAATGQGKGPSAVIANASKYTSFISYYALSKYNDHRKTYLGFGITTSGNMTALDFLWVRDSDIDGTGTVSSSNDNGAAANEGRYLNRGQNIITNAGGSVTFSGYQSASSTTPITLSTESGSVAANSSSTHYFTRTSTVTLTPVPAEGYNVASVVHSSLGTLTDNGDGTYSYVVEGGDDTNTPASYAVQTVTVTFAQGNGPVVDSITANNTTVIIGDTVNLTVANSARFDGLTLQYSVTKDGTPLADATTVLDHATDSAAAENTNTFRATTPGTYVVKALLNNGTDPESYKTVTITVNDAPTMMVLGLWSDNAKAVSAWDADASRNPDRVMKYQLDGEYQGKYVLDLTLNGGSYAYTKDGWEVSAGNTVGNGFKIYDSVDGASLSYDNATFTSTTTNYSIYANNTNIALTGIAPAGTFVYRFVYDADNNKINVYFPQVVTYDMNYTGDTDQTAGVTYGTPAKNITPTRTGYVFEGWYDDAECETPYAFANLTKADTLYAKWSTYDAYFSVNKTINGVGDEPSPHATPVNGNYTAESEDNHTVTLSAPGAENGSFKGWTVSGAEASHILLYKDSACTERYIAGQATTPVYVKSDGTKGTAGDNNAILASEVTITAIYLTNNTVSVDDGTATVTTAESNVTAIGGAAYEAGDAAKSFDYGKNVNVTFGKLSAGMGIKSVTFAAGKAPASYKNNGHYISFAMPANDVQITEIVLEPYTCRITIKDSDKVDVEGLPVGGYFAKGAEVPNVVIVGADDYHGASVLTGATVKYVGGGTVTVNALNDSDELAFDGYTTVVTYEDNTVTISGNIGGNIIVYPACSTEYNVNITSKVVSDAGSNYTTYYKTTSTSSGKESAHVADLKAYIRFVGSTNEAFVAGVDTPEEAAEKVLVWDSEANGGEGALATEEINGVEYYVIAEDVDGDYIDAFPENSTIHLVTENLDSRYFFVGWYKGTSAGPDYVNGQLVSANPTDNDMAGYTYTLTESLFIYGVITRDLYVGGGNLPGITPWTTAEQMTYDAANKYYYYELDNILAGTFVSQENVTNGYWFKLYDKAATGCTNAGGTNNQAVWFNAAHTFEQDQYGVDVFYHSPTYSNENAGFVLTDTTNVEAGTGGTGYKVTLYYKPSTQEVYLIPKYTSAHKEAYLSNGRIDGMGNLGLTGDNAVTATTTFTSDSGTAGSAGETYELVTFSDTHTFTFTTTIGGGGAANVKVAGFVLLNMDNQDAETVTATDEGSNVYSGTCTIDYNAFICPVYELTAAGITATGADSYPITVNAADVDKSTWGGLVSMYTFGSAAYNAAWPGQLLLPEGDGYTGVVYNKNNTLSGITFSNYNTGGAFMGLFADRFEYPDSAQTYDYREPVTLMARTGSSLLTFALKQNNDGYHGFYYNGAFRGGPYRLDVNNTEGVEAVVGQPYAFVDENLGKTLSIDEVYTFDYLTDESGQRLNFYGEQIGSATAGYYIICVGDADYTNNSGVTTKNSRPYTPADGYRGQYSVDWYIYDSNGVFLTYVLSDGFYSKSSDEATYSYVVEKLLASGYTNEDDLSTKSIKISYEAPNIGSDKNRRFSGQWYTTSTETTVTVYAGVGMITTIAGETKIIVPENPQSSASYGNVSIALKSNSLVNTSNGMVNGLKWYSLQAADAKEGNVTLTAATANDSTFMGWYSYNEATNSYTKIPGADSLTYEPKFSADSRYFALFSAQATYNYVYQGRLGLQTISFNGIGMDADELTSGELDLTDSDRTNDVISKAPTNISVFNRTVTFPTDSTATWDNTSEAYTITVYANNIAANTYTLHVYGYAAGESSISELGSITSNYNREVDLVDVALGENKPADYSPGHMAPSDHTDWVFIGWKEYNTSTGQPVGDYISTHPNFGFNITKNMNIVSVFGSVADRTAARTDTWGAYIDRNETNVELSNDGNVIYNDSIIRFTNSSDSAMALDISGAKECGLILLTQEGSQDSDKVTAFTGINKTSVGNYVSHMVSNNKTGAKMNSKFGAAYCYRIKTTVALSNLNRADLCQILKQSDFAGGNYKVAAYYFDGTNYVVSDVVSGTY